jgi:hypothetical protein
MILRNKGTQPKCYGAQHPRRSPSITANCHLGSTSYSANVTSLSITSQCSRKAAATTEIYPSTLKLILSFISPITETFYSLINTSNRTIVRWSRPFKKYSCVNRAGFEPETECLALLGRYPAQILAPTLLF